MAKLSQKLFDTVCERIADGESLRSICEDKEMPSKKSFMQWVNKNEKLGDQYARAIDFRAEHYASDIVHIADTEEDPQKARVMIDARKWTASKLLPKRYGERVTVDTSDSMVDRFARALARDT